VCPVQGSAVLGNPGKNRSVGKEFYSNNVVLMVVFKWMQFESIRLYIHTCTHVLKGGRVCSLEGHT